jgi:hypothetical protein
VRRPRRLLFEANDEDSGVRWSLELNPRRGLQRRGSLDLEVPGGTAPAFRHHDEKTDIYGFWPRERDSGLVAGQTRERDEKTAAAHVPTEAGIRRSHNSVAANG